MIFDITRLGPPRLGTIVNSGMEGGMQEAYELLEEVAKSLR